MGIDFILFAVFLLVNLVIGLRYSGNVKNIRQYALGDRNFSTVTIVSTIVGTWIGGNTLSITFENVYTTGLNYVFACLGMPICIFLIGYFLIPRMGEFLGSLSVAEAMDNMFGKKVRVITAISGFFASAGFIAMQFKILGGILIYFAGINQLVSTIIAAGIIVLYSAFVGLRAVARTAIIQFLTFSALIPMLCIIIWSKINHGLDFEYALNTDIFDYRKVFSLNNPSIIGTVVLFLMFMIPGMEPFLFQRISIGKNTMQVKKAFIVSSGIIATISVLISWIAFLIYAHNQNLNPERLLQYVIDNYTSTGLRGFLFLGIAAMCMSTADSMLNSSSVLIVNDFFKPLKIFSKQHELLLAKITTLVLGVIAIILSFIKGSFLKIVLTGQSFYMPIVTVPLLFAVFGFRSSGRSVLIGMFGGFVTVMFWHINQIEVDSIVPGMLANAICLLSSHYILKSDGGWVGIKDEDHLYAIRSNRRRKIKMLKQEIKSYSFWAYLKNNLPDQESLFSLFGIYVIISTFVLMHTATGIIDPKFLSMYDFYCKSVIIVSSIIMTYPIWPQLFKKESIVSLLWTPSVFYVLSFIPCIMLFITSFDSLQIIVYMTNIVVLSIIMRWKSALLLIISGIVLAVYVAKAVLSFNFELVNFTYQMKLLYTLFLIICVMIYFVRNAQLKSEAELEIKNDLLDSYKKKLFEIEKLKLYKHEFENRLTNDCINVFKEISDNLHSANFAESIKEDVEPLEQIIRRLKTGAKVLEECLYFTNTAVELDVKSINLDSLIEEILYKTKILGLISLQITSKSIHEVMFFDRDLIKRIIFDLLSQFNKLDDIKIIITDDVINVDLDFSKDLKQKIECLCFSISGNITGNVNNEIIQQLSKIIEYNCGELSWDGSNNLKFKIPVDIAKVVKLFPNNDINNFINRRLFDKDFIKKDLLENLAISMIKNGIEDKLISKITGLNINEITKIEKQ